MQQITRCVMCGSEELPNLKKKSAKILLQKNKFLCNTCGAVFPVIENIPLAVTWPLQHILGYIESQKRINAGFDKKLKTIEVSLMENGDGRLHKMMKNFLKGLNINKQIYIWLLDSLQNYMSQIEYKTGSLADLFQIRLRKRFSWNINVMMHYFLKDWFPNKAFCKAKDHIKAGIKKYVKEKNRFVVLGSGAGGLVGEICDLFDSGIGVDLNLPILMLSNRLLKGKKIKVYLAGIQGKIIELGHADKVRKFAGLICADGNRLPIASGTMNLVVSEYLLDIVPKPELLMREIYRILSEDGIWINIGLPFRLNETPKWMGRENYLELPNALKKYEFRILQMERIKYEFADVAGDVKYSTPRATQFPIFFVAKKLKNKRESSFAELFFDYFAERNKTILNAKPSFKRPIRWGKVQVFGPRSKRGVRQECFVENFLDIEVPERLSNIITKLLDNLDGCRKIGEIIRGTMGRGANEANERDLIENIRVMWEDDLIDLSL